MQSKITPSAPNATSTPRTEKTLKDCYDSVYAPNPTVETWISRLTCTLFIIAVFGVFSILLGGAYEAAVRTGEAVANDYPGGITRGQFWSWVFGLTIGSGVGVFTFGAWLNKCEAYAKQTR
jgi:hypothetical protein